MTYYSYTDSPLGRLLLTSDGTHLTGLSMEKSAHGAIVEAGWQQNGDLPVFCETVRQLSGYFDGSLTKFELPLRMEGTAFQSTVWAGLRKIPYGTTISYRELAFRIGHPGASRAVGAANGRNPISVIVPCHRVIGSNGDLVGYGGGLDRKEQLLTHEKTVNNKNGTTNYTACLDPSGN